MTFAGRGAVVRVLALAALIVGLVVMHHLAGATHATGTLPSADTAASATMAEHGAVALHSQSHGAVALHSQSHGAAAADPQESDSDHGSAAHILHLCLAVLTAVVLLVAGVVWRRARRQRPARRAHPSRRPTWSPPAQPFGTALLTRLCVLRT